MAKVRILIISLSISAMLIKLAMAANYTVGGQTGGWDTTTNLQTWASSQSFLVGDNLIFQYAPNHDLLEVSKTDYGSFQASNPIHSYSGGTTTIPLSSPGRKYFICGTLGHCSQGMKVEIDTLVGSTSPNTASPSASSPANSLVTPLVPSPAPESSTSSETPAPETTFPMLLAPSPSEYSPLGNSTSTFIIPSTQSVRSFWSGTSTEPPASSSADEDSDFLVSIIFRFSFIMMLLQV